MAGPGFTVVINNVGTEIPTIVIDNETFFIKKGYTNGGAKNTKKTTELNDLAYNGILTYNGKKARLELKCVNELADDNTLASACWEVIGYKYINELN